MKQSHNISFTFGINGSLRKREVHSPNPCTEYYLFNSAANLKAYSCDALDFAYYGYNASNTRAYKLSMLNTNQWVNGEPQPLSLQLQSAMFYPNAYINFNQNGEYTKHYYNGSERIASRLGDVNLSIAFDYDDMLEIRKNELDERFRSDMQDLFNEEVPVDNLSMLDVSSLQQTGNPTDVFYYHPNHLGSTAFVTDENATVTQSFLYAPFGEITTEYNATFGNDIIPKYSFNAKELDEETGMYYYEARYYKPPVFTSRDAMFEKYFWMTPYAYCANNPVKYVDPDGREKLIWLNKDNNKTIISGANNYRDDGAIHIFAHGSSKGMTVEIDGKKQTVTNGKQLDKLLSEYSEIWKNKKEGDNITIVLHSCRTGEGDDSFAQKVSKDLGVTVIAPDQRDYFSKDGEIGTYKAKYTDENNEYKRNDNGEIKSKERSNEMGNWRVFKNGEEIESYKGCWKPKEKPTLWEIINYLN